MNTKTLAIALAAFLGSYSRASAHDEPTIETLRVETSLAMVGGTLTIPHSDGKPPCVLILGGTLSQDRDGVLLRKDVPKRDALRRLADALTLGGYASFRYDKVGYGESRPNAKWTGSYGDEARVAAELLAALRRRSDLGPIVIAGESAGGYLAGLAAKDGALADAYLFLGALCGSSEEMYAHAFGNLANYAKRSDDRRAWAEKHARLDLAIGRHYQEMLAVARDGKDQFELVDGDFKQTMKGLHRRREEFKFPPDELFKHITKPALFLQGERDLNVPPTHAARAAEIARKAGNERVKAVTIAGVDHSFQYAPDDADLRIRERHTFASFSRSYSPQVYAEILLWLSRTLSAPTAHAADDPTPAKQPDAKPIAVKPGLEINRRAAKSSETDPLTANTPRRDILAPGIEIVPNITDRTQTAGVETLEGRIGPLLLAEGCQAHFIDMPAGMFVGEHPHKSESIIYTVRGDWVLCSGGRRVVMKPGSLFRFTANTPTGYEVPFKDNAFILIFKGGRTTREEKEFIDYLQGMAKRLNEEHARGVPYKLADLPADHPANVFGKQLTKP